jgi:hypothetical protein
MNIGNYVLTIKKRNSPKQIDELDRLNKLLRKQNTDLSSLTRKLRDLEKFLEKRDAQIEVFSQLIKEQYFDTWKFTYVWRGKPKSTSMITLIQKLVDKLDLEIVPDANNGVLLAKKPTTVDSVQSTQEVTPD